MPMSRQPIGLSLQSPPIPKAGERPEEVSKIIAVSQIRQLDVDRSTRKPINYAPNIKSCSASPMISAPLLGRGYAARKVSGKYLRESLDASNKALGSKFY